MHIAIYISFQQYTQLPEGQKLEQSLKDAVKYETENPDWFTQTHSQKIIGPQSQDDVSISFTI